MTIQAHPDDQEFSIAGTLAAWRAPAPKLSALSLPAEIR